MAIYEAEWKASGFKKLFQHWRKKSRDYRESRRGKYTLKQYAIYAEEDPIVTEVTRLGESYPYFGQINGILVEWNPRILEWEVVGEKNL